jgi:hypothetical protein
MNKKRRFPRYPDCPLTKVEKVRLSSLLDEIEWRTYLPLKHRTSAYADAKVTEYDEIEIHVKIEFGIDGESHDTDYLTIQRSELLCVTS